MVHANSYPPCLPGDSLGVNRKDELESLFVGLERWLGDFRRGPVSNGGRRFKIGRQADGGSCGVCILNAMDHSMFKTEIFTHQCRALVRMELFSKLVQHLLENVFAFCLACLHIAHS